MDLKKISLLFLFIMGLVNSVRCDKTKDFFHQQQKEMREFGEYFKEVNHIITSEAFIDFEKKQLDFEQSFLKLNQMYKNCVDQGPCNEVEIKLLGKESLQLFFLREEAIQKIHEKEDVSKDSLLSLLLMKRAQQ